MIKEFEGKTEEEAIGKAMAALGLSKEEFDVEILENSSKGIFFKKGSVKIRIHLDDDHDLEMGPPRAARTMTLDKDIERKIITFVETMISKMGYRAVADVESLAEGKMTLAISTEDTNILIGKHGRNLDALQVLVNVFTANLMDGKEENLRVVLDMENYRGRREESLVRMAQKTAQQVKRSQKSQLLEPMNPFERRLVHTALADMGGISTESEGDGLYKQVRILYTGRED